MAADPQSKVRQIAFYGKGGIGKSTIVANLSSAMVQRGLQVLQVGCDPKRDSSRPFWDGHKPATVIDLLREHGGQSPAPGEYLRESPSGVHFLEVGGPEPGVGCAGRGILKMFELLDAASVLESGFEVALYDVLGDVVCGGFAAPLRSGKAKEVYVVASGEFMAIYAANNICKGIATYAARRQVRLGGIVLNCRDVPGERAIVEAFAKAINSQVVGVVPRDVTVSKAERKRQTVVESFGDSAQADVYRELATTLLTGEQLSIPAPLDDDALEELYYRVADQAG